MMQFGVIVGFFRIFKWTVFKCIEKWTEQNNEHLYTHYPDSTFVNILLLTHLSFNTKTHTFFFSAEPLESQLHFALHFIPKHLDTHLLICDVFLCDQRKIITPQCQLSICTWLHNRAPDLLHLAKLKLYIY